MAHLRIVGDVHGMTVKHVNLVKDCDYSLQIGDMAFNYDALAYLDSDRHWFFGGNHENMDAYYDCPNAIGDYGHIKMGEIPLFFIRGAFSIDKKLRLEAELRGEQKTWWSKEQLSIPELSDAMDSYTNSKPDLMVTHTAPLEIAKMVGTDGALKMYGLDPKNFTTNTQEALQLCFDIHKPKVWIFGHFHKEWVLDYKGTLFICLNELDYIDIDENGRFCDASIQDCLD